MEKPVVAQKGPYILETTTGKYAWCACGRSKGQPFCDGSHAGTGIVPNIVEIPETKTVAWCGCKQTNNPPFCDGSHDKL